MSNKPRLVWFDANRVFAAIGVVMIHSTTDFAGQPFAQAEVGERIIPVILRSIGAFSGSEMFFLFSLFLMAMRVDRKLPSYGSAIKVQAQRLLVPFAFWVVFYAFFRLIKADTFGYAPYIWDQLSQPSSWLGYFILGNSQYHMHFLPTLFALFLFFPLMRIATRYPVIGLTLFVTLGVMNNTQGFIWGLGLEAEIRDYIIRAIKILGYVGYGFAAFAIYGLWKDGIPRGESRLIRRGALYFALLAYVATLPVHITSMQTGAWGMRSGWDFYGHFLMPVFMFFLFLGGQYQEWSPIWSKLAKYSFGVYLVHPFVIDLYDVAVFSSGFADSLSPTAIVLSRFLIALPASFGVALALSRFPPLAWTIGLGPTPWAMWKGRMAGA